MKRAYVRPAMVGERFVANEYVAIAERCINLNVMLAVVNLEVYI